MATAKAMRFARIVLILLWPIGMALPAPAQVSDSGTGVKAVTVLGQKRKWRKFRWQSTRTAASFLNVSIAAMTWDADVVSFPIGLLSLAVTLPSTIIAIPADILLAPIRTSKVVRLRISGRVVDHDQKPLANIPVQAVVKGEYLVTQHFTPEYTLFTSTYSATTNEDGKLDMEVEGSLNPNWYFMVHLYAVGRIHPEFEYIQIAQEGRELKVRAKSWYGGGTRLIPD
ncbi:MAG: hypothetical protein SF051_14115 [Elusimicrobiota bacterium]|nr:hypothetical protein [Elusimicrobiota bacterium]